MTISRKTKELWIATSMTLVSGHTGVPKIWSRNPELNDRLRTQNARVTRNSTPLNTAMTSTRVW